ncbi:FG-GAP repeat protein [Phytomonospora endophytica]|uniref:Uncharacterized protein n=1 Tax=Phytomonospora endophytica TaxID=714109 RepID=A0A841FW23_9ACTN|nr:FG-GAP repeat protein [Phytomonospora endophytica]MBB6036180.1 hypothetical protein [Phytomonospora endophytica]GIG67085.1 hypothetical protein Pen01_33800 [Phytomonospora endophytica]
MPTPPRGPRMAAFTFGAALAATALVVIPATAAQADACVGGVDSDYNGDGVRDIAIGDFLGHDGWDEAGWVRLQYGGGNDTYWYQFSQDSDGVSDSSEYQDRFGLSLASADFNADGCSDLVVGAPFEDVGGKTDAGRITVLYGSPTGLTGKGTAYTQDSAGWPGGVEAGDYFGYAVAAGNLANGEPYLYVGAPGEKFKSAWGEGVVYYRRGSYPITTFNQDSPGVAGSAEADDRFGTYIAATDTHVVVTAPTETIGGDADAGSISIFSQAMSSGRPKPITGLDQDSSKVSGSAEKGDEFGGSLAAIPYRPSGATATGTLVAVGVPFEDVNANTRKNAGMIHTLFISASGGVSQVAEYNQDVSGVTGTAESNDTFGFEVRLANLGDPAFATPATAMLATTVAREANPDGSVGAIQTFRFDTSVGGGDGWVVNGAYGLPQDAFENPPCVGVSASRLYAGFPNMTLLYGIPWSNIRDGATDQLTYDEPGHAGYDGGCAAFL